MSSPKALPRLVETGSVEVRALLEAGLADAPGPHLLPALRAAVTASIVLSGTLASTVVANTASPGSATASGMFAKVTANGIAVATKTALPLAVAKALVAGLLLGSALCGGAILTGRGREPAAAASARTKPSSAASDKRPQVAASSRSEEAAASPRPDASSGAGEGLVMLASANDDGRGTVSRSSPTRATARSAHQQGEPVPAVRLDPTDSAGEEAPAAGSAATARPAPDAPNSLALEIGQIDEARALLNAGQPARALATLAQYERMGPSAVLRREAMILRVEALLARGDRNGARSLAAEYLARYPNDVHGARMKEIGGADRSVE